MSKSDQIEAGQRYGAFDPVPLSEANGYVRVTGPRPKGRDGSLHDAPLEVGLGVPPRSDFAPIRLGKKLHLRNVNLIGGVTIEGYEEVIIQRCMIMDWETFGLKIRGCLSVRVDGNTYIGPGDIDKGGRGYALLIEDCHNANVQGNKFVDCHIGVSGVRSSGLRVIENEGDNCRWIADLHVPACHGAYIVGNVAPGAEIGIGSWAWSGRSTGCQVKNNRVSGYQIHGNADGTVIEHPAGSAAKVWIQEGFDGAVTRNLDLRGDLRGGIGIRRS